MLLPVGNRQNCRDFQLPHLMTGGYIHSSPSRHCQPIIIPLIILNHDYWQGEIHSSYYSPIILPSLSHHSPMNVSLIFPMEKPIENDRCITRPALSPSPAFLRSCRWRWRTPHPGHRPSRVQPSEWSWCTWAAGQRSRVHWDSLHDEFEWDSHKKVRWFNIIYIYIPKMIPKCGKKLHIQNPKIDMGGIEDIHKWEVVHGMGLPTFCDWSRVAIVHPENNHDGNYSDYDACNNDND